MGKYIVRRLLTAIPTILVISFIIFAIVDLSPSDPTGNLPLTIPPEVRQKIREALGADDPFVVKYIKWLNQFFIAEPLNLIEATFGVTFPGSEERTRVISWATRGPVIDIIVERLPQTLWVVGSSYISRCLDCDSSWGLLRLSAVFGLRSSRHLPDDGWLFGADLFHRFDVHHHLQRKSQVVPIGV